MKPTGEIVSLNLNDLAIDDLERRLETSLLTPGGWSSTCPSDCSTNCCPQLTLCENYSCHPI